MCVGGAVGDSPDWKIRRGIWWVPPEIPLAPNLSQPESLDKKEGDHVHMDKEAAKRIVLTFSRKKKILPQQAACCLWGS